MENSHLLQLIGQTQTDKLIQDCKNKFFDNYKKEFPNYQLQLAKACCLVSITKDKEIKSIGMSCMNDLLSNNFGNFLAGILAVQQFSSKDTGGITRNYGVPSGNNAYNMFNTLSLGTQIQVGEGSTLATRDDFVLENPFGTSPESSQFNVAGSGGWNSVLGQISISGLITAGGSGAISEVILIQRNRSTDSLSNFCLWSRDNISPVVNFIPAQTINVNYSLLL